MVFEELATMKLHFLSCVHSKIAVNMGPYNQSIGIAVLLCPPCVLSMCNIDTRLSGERAREGNGILSSSCRATLIQRIAGWLGKRLAVMFPQLLCCFTPSTKLHISVVVWWMAWAVYIYGSPTPPSLYRWSGKSYYGLSSMKEKGGWQHEIGIYRSGFMVPEKNYYDWGGMAL